MSETRTVKIDYSNAAHLLLLAALLFDHITLRTFWLGTGVIWGMNFLLLFLSAVVVAFQKAKAKP